MSLFPTQVHFAHKTNKTKFNLPNCVSTCLLSFKNHSAHITHSHGSPAGQIKSSIGNVWPPPPPPLPSLVLNFQPFFVSDGSFIWGHDESVRIKLYQEKKTAKLASISFSRQFYRAEQQIPLSPFATTSKMVKQKRKKERKFKFSMATRKMMVGERAHWNRYVIKTSHLIIGFSPLKQRAVIMMCADMIARLWDVREQRQDCMGLHMSPIQLYDWPLKRVTPNPVTVFMAMWQHGYQTSKHQFSLWLEILSSATTSNRVDSKLWNKKGPPSLTQGSGERDRVWPRHLGQEECQSLSKCIGVSSTMKAIQGQMNE